MITCQECGFGNEEGAKFCDRCGQGLDAASLTKPAMALTPQPDGTELPGGVRIIALPGPSDSAPVAMFGPGGRMSLASSVYM